MEEKNIQTKINNLENKVDLILEYVNQQRLKSNSVDDLIADISIVAKDIYDTAVTGLEDRAIEIDPEDVKQLLFRFLRNIRNFNAMLDTFESITDFIKDAAPIANEMIIDFTKKLHEFEKKGYFEFLGETSAIFDNIVTHFSRDDIKALSENIVTILETVKNLTQPEMLNSVNNAVRIYGSLEMEQVPDYSIWRLMREMNKPEMKRGLGFMVTLMKNLSNPNNKIKTN